MVILNLDASRYAILLITPQVHSGVLRQHPPPLRPRHHERHRKDHTSGGSLLARKLIVYFCFKIGSFYTQEDNM